MTRLVLAAAGAVALFSVGAAIAQTTGTAPATLAPPSYTAAQAERGAALYAANCVDCHGANLDDGEFAVALKGPLFRQHWGGKALTGPFEVMTSQMPPTNPGGLGAQAYADILAFVLSKNEVPSGDAELPADPGALAGMAAPQ